jgi:hypothetical protein
MPLFMWTLSLDLDFAPLLKMQQTGSQTHNKAWIGGHFFSITTTLTPKGSI